MLSSLADSDSGLCGIMEGRLFKELVLVFCFLDQSKFDLFLDWF